MSDMKDDIVKLFKHTKIYYENGIKKTFPDTKLITGRNRGVVIYPTGRKTKLLVESLTKNKIKVIALGDGDKNLWGKRIGPLEILPATQLAKKYSDFPIIVSSTDYRKEITDFLGKTGFRLIYHISFLNFIDPDIFIVFPEYAKKFNALFGKANQSNIIKLNALWSDTESKKVFLKVLKFRLTFNDTIFKEKPSYDKEYFDRDITSFSKNEVLVDGGAYIGDTIKKFNLITHGRFKKIYAFEPDKINFERLYYRCQEINGTKIMCILGGIYSYSGKINFMETGDPTARVADSNGTHSINVFSIDNFVKDKEIPTFIKMDIEGSETAALLGAGKTIEKYKPKLAISVYHNETDLWDIPLLIKRLNNDYKLYLRHYSNEIMDTVCYAV